MYSLCLFNEKEKKTNSGKSEVKMVQTQFTWRYGGHQVFLCGSFNRWSERIQMSLIEGSGTTFQRAIDLPPGCYQYKFLVDGTWKVDQLQICEPDEYGTMNNIVLVSGTELLPPDFTAEASTSRGSSSVDPHIASSEIEMDVFRQVLSIHLLSSTAYELVPISGKVAVLDVDVDVEQAFHVMHEMGLMVVPLRDENRGEMAGMLTASDFILILRQLHRNRTMFSNQELERRTVSSWKSWKLQNHREMKGTFIPFPRRPLIHAGPDESLGDLASRILQNNICSVPILHSENGSCPRLLHVACLAGILENICRHIRNHLGYLPSLQQPVGFLAIGTWAIEVGRASGRPLLTLHPDDSLNTALTLLVEAQISSVPIVDGEGNLINMYSRSDITSLAKDNLYTRVQLDRMTISQVLEVTGGAGRIRYRTCTRSDSLYWVMGLLSAPDVRRVIVVDASSCCRVEGIITLKDVFNFFLR